MRHNQITGFNLNLRSTFDWHITHCSQYGRQKTSVGNYEFQVVRLRPYFRFRLPLYFIRFDILRDLVFFLSSKVGHTLRLFDVLGLTTMRGTLGLAIASVEFCGLLPPLILEVDVISFQRIGLPSVDLENGTEFNLNGVSHLPYGSLYSS